MEGLLEKLSATDAGLGVIIAFMALDKAAKFLQRRNGGSPDAKTISAVLEESNGQIRTEVERGNGKLDCVITLLSQQSDRFQAWSEITKARWDPDRMRQSHEEVTKILGATKRLEDSVSKHREKLES